MILLRATQLDTFMRFATGQRLHRGTDELYTADTVRESFLHFNGNRRTRLGTAFHGFLSYPDNYKRVGADGNGYYIYEFPDYGADGKLQRFVSQKTTVMEPLIEIFRPVREQGATEIREYRTYDIGPGINLTGEVDGLLGLDIHEVKTTAQSDYQRYETAWQPQVYMELLGADRVIYHVFTVREGIPCFKFIKYETFTILRKPDLSNSLANALGRFWEWVKTEPEILQLLTQAQTAYVNQSH